MRVLTAPAGAANLSVMRFALAGLCMVCLATALGPGPAPAEPRHAVAMHGEPKYPPGFAGFDYVNVDAPKGGTLRLAVIGGFDSVHPFIIKGVPAAGLSLTYEALMKRSEDEPFSLYGLIAESVEVAEDRSWIAFTLRKEARFADGRPVTVDDVIFSQRTLRDHGRPNHRLFYRQVERVERFGERGVRFHFGDDANRELALIMGLMPVLPAHWFAERPFEENTLTPMPGSGPYAIADIDPGRTIVYRRRPDYWGRRLAHNKGQYNFDRVEYQYYRDANVALEAFKAGAYDLRFEDDPSRWAEAYDFPAVEAGEVIRESVEIGRPAGMLGFAFNTRRAMFKDRRVRFALAHAMDFDWINRTLFHGLYFRTNSYFANSDLAARGLPGPAELALLEPWRGRIPDEVFQRAYRAPDAVGGAAGLRRNLQKAFDILADAGWRVRDGELVHDKTGRAMSFEILLHDPRTERVALAYAGNLKRLGVDARVRTVDAAQYERLRRAFDFDVTIIDWYQSLSPGTEQWYYWGSAQADVPGSRNYAGVKDPAVDALVGHLTTARSRAELIAAARALDRVLLWSHYVVPLYHARAERLAYWNNLDHPARVPIYGHNLTTWWTRAERRSAH